MTNSVDNLSNLLKLYLDTRNEFDENNSPEFEIRFGTRKIKNIQNINKINYDNVIKILKSMNFTFDDIGRQYLNINPDLSDKKLRIQINGLTNIQKYCQNNNIIDENGNIYTDVSFMTKDLIEDESVTNPANIDNFNFRASYQNEEMIISTDEINSIIGQLKNVKKFYRLIKRFTFNHEDYPVNIDLSIVKESKNKFYNIKESNIFDGSEKYEIEIELDNDKINDSTDFKQLDGKIKKLIKIILSGLQDTPYPISYPEITEMQAEALLGASLRLKKEGYNPKIEIMIPLVSHVNEFVHQKNIVVGVYKRLSGKYGLSLKYKIGTMIEVPRACLIAEEIAKHADFFSFGTNDLTQTTFGFSRDDTSTFFEPYFQEKVLPGDPFEKIDQDGVGKLMRFAVEDGRKTKKSISIGICGEHGGEPESIGFCRELGLNYVSCSPFRIPIARLAAAQAEL